MIRKRNVFLISAAIAILGALGLLGLRYINKQPTLPRYAEPEKSATIVPNKSISEYDYKFPKSNPEFTAKISSTKVPSAEQQSIVIYKINRNNQTLLFQHQPNDDWVVGTI